MTKILLFKNIILSSNFINNFRVTLNCPSRECKILISNFFFFNLKKVLEFFLNYF